MAQTTNDLRDLLEKSRLANRPSPSGFADDQARAAVSSISESGDTIHLAVSDFLPEPQEMDNQVGPATSEVILTSSCR
jgi:hypothetical protein